jgi:hypothetical protein
MKKNENFNKNNKKTIMTMITKMGKKYRQDDTKQGGGGYDMAIRCQNAMCYSSLVASATFSDLTREQTSQSQSPVF